MKSIIFLLFITISLFSDVKHKYIDQEIVNSGIPIVDIRTPGEWKETGLVKGAIPLTFFDEQGNYNEQQFIDELKKKVDTTKPFAMICHSGSRTYTVSSYLAKKYNFNIVNLYGGMLRAFQVNIPMQPYKP